VRAPRAGRESAARRAETSWPEPPLGILVDRVSALHDRIAVADRGDERWASTLTAAELRLLPLLTTHLTFREIGDRLFVSRATVKTQGSRFTGSWARVVQRAAELGLLEPLFHGNSSIATVTAQRMS